MSLTCMHTAVVQNANVGSWKRQHKIHGVKYTKMHSSFIIVFSKLHAVTDFNHNSVIKYDSHPFTSQFAAV